MQKHGKDGENVGKARPGRAPYINQYQREHYYRYGVLLPIASKAALQAYAAERGESLNAVIVAAIEAYTGIDLSDN